jgi:hypothetical protein
MAPANPRLFIFARLTAGKAHAPWGDKRAKQFYPRKRLFCNTSHPALQLGWRAAIDAKFRAHDRRVSAFSRLCRKAGQADLHQKKL